MFYFIYRTKDLQNPLQLSSCLPRQPAYLYYIRIVCQHLYKRIFDMQHFLGNYILVFPIYFDNANRYVFQFEAQYINTHNRQWAAIVSLRPIPYLIVLSVVLSKIPTKTPHIQ